MEMREHTFPLPANVTKSLEKVEHELEEQPLQQKALDYVRANPWQVVAGAAVFGLACAFLTTKTVRARCSGG
jgi:ElaB/YqjD/DUF883 family membrane-anchored ribosome-binding protein